MYDVGTTRREREWEFSTLMKNDYTKLERISSDCELWFVFCLFCHSKFCAVIACENERRQLIIKVGLAQESRKRRRNANTFVIANAPLKRCPMYLVVVHIYCCQSDNCGTKFMTLFWYHINSKWARLCAIGLLFAVFPVSVSRFPSRACSHIRLLAEHFNFTNRKYVRAPSLWWHLAHRNALSIRMLY